MHLTSITFYFNQRLRCRRVARAFDPVAFQQILFSGLIGHALYCLWSLWISGQFQDDALFSVCLIADAACKDKRHTGVRLFIYSNADVIFIWTVLSQAGRGIVFFWGSDQGLCVWCCVLLCVVWVCLCLVFGCVTRTEHTNTRQTLAKQTNANDKHTTHTHRASCWLASMVCCLSVSVCVGCLFTKTHKTTHKKHTHNLKTNTTGVKPPHLRVGVSVIDAQGLQVYNKITAGECAFCVLCLFVCFFA